MSIEAQFWRDKRVLLTGHTGFKGSWLSLWLQSLGCDLYGFSLSPSTRPNMFDMLGLDVGMESRIGDIRDFSSVRAVVEEAKPEIVIHMAAQPLVRESYADPSGTFSTNVTGTINLLEALRLFGATKAFLNVTTDKCYENREWIWGYKEHDHLGGHDPYSSSKACSELVTSSYRRSFFSSSDDMAVGTARAGNVIGGGDWSRDRLIPDALKAFRSDQTLVIRNPDATRPWQHVLEPLSGYLCLTQRLFEGELWARDAWNFGPFDEDIKPVSYLVSRISQSWPGVRQWGIDSSEHVHEANLLKLDISKARAILGWSPTWDLDVTLDSILSWEKCLERGGDLRVETMRQIEQFMNDMGKVA